jgi:hypothetical protein
VGGGSGMNRMRGWAAIAVGLALWASTSRGQRVAGPAQPRDTGATLSKIFGAHAAFAATVEISINDVSGKLIHRMEASQTMLDGKLRTDTGFAKGQAGAEAPGPVTEMGMGRATTLFLPSERTTYMIYPGLKAYATLNLEQGTNAAAQVETKVERKELGKEPAMGHPCTKYKVIVTDAQGPQLSIVWEADDLKNFPVKVQMATDEGTTITMQFKDIKFERPDPALFVPPSDYRKYGSVRQMQMEATHKMMGEMPGHGGAHGMPTGHPDVHGGTGE